jgi:protein O-mannosyl-transferase
MVKKKKIKETRSGSHYLYLVIIVIVAAIAYIPSLNNDFVNWDDIIYVMNNDMIKSISLENFARIWSTFWMGNYHPVTILSFAFDYQLFQMTSHGYHYHNLLLHLGNTVLVYFFCNHLFAKNITVASIVALLFAIHPMHVESVAWISERKDLLYTFYYLLALISYVYYCRNKKILYFLLALVFFIFSLLSKAQAVTLPLILLLIDYYLSRKITLARIAEKVPFFLLALACGIVAIYAQKADNSINAVGLKGLSSLFFGFYGIWFYLIKFVFPVYLNCLYEYPLTGSGNIPFYIYLSPVIVILLVGILFITWKKNPYITFGLLFFLFGIFPVLQFLPVGQAVVAERYSYIPYIGLLIITAFGFEMLRKTLKANRQRLLTSFGFIVIFLFFILTWGRAAVWKDSVSLWTDVMEKNPRSVTAYVNRGYIYNQDPYKQYDKAIKDCNDGLKVDSNNFKLYINRGTSFRKLEMYDLAINDFSKALQKNPKSNDTYLDRGILYTDRFAKYDLGIADFREFLKHAPNNKDGYYNMGVAFYKKGVYDSSMVYTLKAIALSREYALAHFLCAILYSLKNDYKDAYYHGSQAEMLGYSIDQELLKSWRIKAEIPATPSMK